MIIINIKIGRIFVLKIATLLKQGVLIVRVEGELDMHVADEFKQIVDKALHTSGAKNIMLSLQGVSFIDSSGLGVILGRYKRSNILGGKMLLVDIQPQVARIFEVSGLLKIIKMYKSETEALECL
jgi:stage II sporulation protein AA (anti-sigma F factor antagonist)